MQETYKSVIDYSIKFLYNYCDISIAMLKQNNI